LAFPIYRGIRSSPLWIESIEKDGMQGAQAKSSGRAEILQLAEIQNWPGSVATEGYELVICLLNSRTWAQVQRFWALSSHYSTKIEYQNNNINCFILIFYESAFAFPRRLRGEHKIHVSREKRSKKILILWQNPLASWIGEAIMSMSH